MRYVLVNLADGRRAVPTDPRFRQESAECALREDRAAGIVMHHEQTAASFTDRAIFLAELAGEFVLAPATAELMYETEIRGHSGSCVLKVVDDEGK